MTRPKWLGGGGEMGAGNNKTKQTKPDQSEGTGAGNNKTLICGFDIKGRWSQTGGAEVENTWRNGVMGEFKEDIRF